jgi:hypothetical protein
MQKNKTVSKKLVLYTNSIDCDAYQKSSQRKSDWSLIQAKIKLSMLKIAMRLFYPD